VLAQTLSRWEFDVTIVADGAEAWRHLEGVSTPMLAVLDRMMPGVDGAEICRRVRRDMPNANMYLVLLTSLGGGQDVVSGLDAGADDYVTKPFDVDELRARIHVGVRVVTLQEKLSQRVLELQAALANVKQLHGLLPICSYCKRIRGDDQYWQQVEGYVAEHSDAQFSHGICPPCYEKVSAEIDELSRNRPPR
jgi:CheY-like chemotaxis protein